MSYYIISLGNFDQSTLLLHATMPHTWLRRSQYCFYLCVADTPTICDSMLRNIIQCCKEKHSFYHICQLLFGCAAVDRLVWAVRYGQILSFIMCHCECMTQYVTKDICKAIEHLINVFMLDS